MWKSLSFCSKRVLWSCYIGKILHVMVTVMPSDRCRRMNTTTTAASSATAATDTAVYPIAGLAVAEPTATSSMPSTETADAVKTQLPRPSLQHHPSGPLPGPCPSKTNPLKLVGQMASYFFLPPHLQKSNYGCLPPPATKSPLSPSNRPPRTPSSPHP